VEVQGVTRRVTALGTAEVLSSRRRWTSEISSEVNLGREIDDLIAAPTSGLENRVAMWLYCEKLGVNDGIIADGTIDRRELAVASCQGFGVEAAIRTAAWHAQRGVPVGILTDWDIAGLNIARRFSEAVLEQTGVRPIHLGLRLEHLRVVLGWRQEQDGQRHSLEEMLEEQELSYDPNLQLDALIGAGFLDEVEKRVMDPRRTVGRRWLLRRIELNNLTPEERSRFVEMRLDQEGIGRVLPPDRVLERNWTRVWRVLNLRMAAEAVQQDRRPPSPPRPADPLANLRAKVRALQRRRRDRPWDLAEAEVVEQAWRRALRGAWGRGRGGEGKKRLFRPQGG
jgi:hypothetical protein